MLGQTHHFRQYAPQRIEYAVDRYTREAVRLYGVIDGRLAEAPYFAGVYSIADIAIYPWTRSHENQGVDLTQFPNVQRWQQAISARPAVQRGLEVLRQRRRPLLDERAREVLFGATQTARR
jgi:GSH-dependent disulfide-bond oxidoreductase